MPKPATRKTVLLLHILASAGLFGAVAAYFALAVTGLIGTEEISVRAAYRAGGLITWWLILPLGVAALATGMLSSLVSPWGLFRHYWVVVKLALTFVILGALILHAFPIAHMAEQAFTAEFGLDSIVPQRLQLLLAAGAGLLAILAVSVLSVFKPRGLTRHGWRKQRE
jgi:cytochrome b subunit of formate dehydrogenase